MHRNANENEDIFNAEVNNSNDFNESDEEELMKFFKNCVVAQDRSILKVKLETSIEFRRKILKNPPAPIKNIFAFYFVDPNLVYLLFFNITYYVD